MPTKKELPKIDVEKRKITGRKVKALRKSGILPANIYGREVKSLSVQLDLRSFLPIFKEVGETGLVELKVPGETKVRPVLVHNVQVDPLSDQPIHIDFYQVDLKKKVSAVVPIELVGESPAVNQKIGILIQPLSEIEVEALPTDLPDELTVDISRLKEIKDAITVADLKVDKEKVRVLTQAEEIVAKIEPPAKEEVVTPPPAAEVPVEGIPAEEGAAAPEAAPPAEEVPKQEKTPEQAPK